MEWSRPFIRTSSLPPKRDMFSAVAMPKEYSVLCCLPTQLMMAEEASLVLR